MSAVGHDDSSGLKGGTWKGGYLMVDGSAKLHLWLKVDASENITDRMVIKDLWSKESAKEPHAYRGIYNCLARKGLDFGVDKRRPAGWARKSKRFLREAYIQGFLTDNSGASSSANTVPLRGYRKGHLSDISKGTHWRLYMDYLHSGDLWNLMHNHTIPVGGKNSTQRPIPEAFIWWTLSCLAEALVEIDKRTLTRKDARTQQDEAIVLVDMKPPNILIDTTRGPRYPVYPKPLIADFGSAQLIHKDDPKAYAENSEIVDTTGFCAPETIEYDETDNGTHEPIHSWTNVWQTGRVIESMVRLEYCVQNNDWENEDDVDRESKIMSDPPKYDRFPGFQYSDELKHIVYHCQRFDPKLRPTPTELVAFINQHAHKHNSGMHEWATKEWIEERALALKYISEEERAAMRVGGQARYRNGDLDFLRCFPKSLADKYINFDTALPDDCELAYEGRPDTVRVGYRIEEDEDDEMGDEDGDVPDVVDPDDDEDVPDVADSDDDDYNN